MVDSTANSIVVEDLTGDLETVRWTGEKAELFGAASVAGLGVYGAATGTNRLGQYYCWNRNYDVNLGRWTTPDPVATPWWSLFDYVFGRSTQRVDFRGLEPITASAAAWKCITGALAGAAIDYGFQHIGDAWDWISGCWDGDTSRAGWSDTDWCSVILSSIIGCVAAPVGAAVIEPWITKQLAKIGVGGAIGGASGTLMSKLLMFLAKKLAVGIPKSAISFLLKLGCIKDTEASELENAEEQKSGGTGGTSSSNSGSPSASSRPGSSGGGSGESKPTSPRNWPFDPNKVVGPMSYNWCMDCCSKEAPRVFTPRTIQEDCEAACKPYK